MASTAILVLGYFVNARVAVHGFMPLDQSIVFDSAWRILSGQVPIRDYATPNGFVPALVQAGVFRVAGVTWTSYTAHASVLNALFGLTTLLALRAVGAPLSLATFYAAASVVIFQPPFGTPFMDQAGFFFALVAIALALMGADPADRRGQWVTVAVPAALALSFLSKQVPAAMVVPVVLVLCVVRTTNRGRTAVLLAMSTASVVSLVAVLLVLAGVPLNDFVYHVWTLPSQVGAGRMRAAPSPLWGYAVPHWSLLTPAVTLLGAALLVVAGRAPTAGGRLRIHHRWLSVAVMLALAAGAAAIRRMPTPALARAMPDPAPVVALLNDAAGYAAIVTGSWLAVRALRRLLWNRRPWSRAPASVWLGVIGAGLIIVCCMFVSVTTNQIENGVPFAFLALGMLHVGVLDVLNPSSVPSTPPWRARTGRVSGSSVGVLITVVFIVITVADVAMFQRRVNDTRTVHDFAYDPAAADVTGLPDGLGLRLDGPLTYTGEELGSVTTKVTEGHGAVVIFGDTTVIAALAGVESVSPLLWLDPGLVYPGPGAARFDEFDHWLADALRHRDTRTVVVERAGNPWNPPSSRYDGRDVPWSLTQTWTGARLADYPRAVQVIKQRRCALERVGPFIVLDLCGSADVSIDRGHRRSATVNVAPSRRS